MNRLLVAWLLLLAWSPPSAVAQGTGNPGLTRLIEAELARFPAKVGVYVKHTVTGEEAGVMADEPFNSMSVIKVPLMALAYQMAERGELDLDERVEVREEDLRPGSGMLYLFDLGMQVSVRDLILQMIITSDNTATDLVLAQVGGMDALNAWIEEQGYEETRMLANLSDWFRGFYAAAAPEFAEFSDTEVFAATVGQGVLRPGRYPEAVDLNRRTLGSVSPDELARWRDSCSSDRNRWLGSTTPREMGRILEAIQTEALSSPAHAEEMRRVMLRQRVGVRRIPDLLAGYAVAHKTGDCAPNIANDAGIVFAPSGAIVLSFFTADNRSGDYRQLQELIGRVSRSVVDYFEGAR